MLLPENDSIRKPVMRIISLVPSITEMLAGFGLEQEVVGITRFCKYPESWFHSKMRVGGTKKLNVEKIRQLKPDLILANKEENTQEQIEELAETSPVYVSEILNLEDALDMIEVTGELTNRKEEAMSLKQSISHEFQRLESLNFQHKRAAYFIWKRPWMAVGSHTFIEEIMKYAGFDNVFGNRPRYPQFELEELQKLQPEIILLSSEPFPFKEDHKRELESYFSEAKILLVDGEMFSWYGSRILKAPDYFIQLRKSVQ